MKFEVNVVKMRIISLQASFTWTDWLRFKSMEIAYTALNVCDYLGDSLSSFFGITTPKYQFEIDHFNMMKKLVNNIFNYYILGNNE